MRTFKKLLMALFLFGSFCSMCQLLVDHNVGGVKDKIFLAQAETRRQVLESSQSSLGIHEVRVTEVSEIENASINFELRDNLFNGKDQTSIVAIPYVNIYLPIFHEDDHDALKKGAMLIKNNSTINNGLGNYVIAAHNFNDGARAFSRLQQSTNSSDEYLENGNTKYSNWLNEQEIFLADKKGISVYVINQQTVFTEENLAYAQETKDNRLTLITCLYPEDNFRIVTIAALKESFEWENAPERVTANFSLDKTFNN